MQQMQIDESRLPKGNYEIVKSLRHIEFDLREITESTMRKEVKKMLKHFLCLLNSIEAPCLCSPGP